MSETEDFFSFDEALDQLRLKEEELKRLVSEGEIRAFREGETMKLRRRDVEELRNELMGGDVVDLGEATEALVFEDDADLEDPGMATEELSAADTLLDDVEELEDLDLEDAEVEDLEGDEDEDEDDDDDEEAVAGEPVEHEPTWVLAAAIAATLVLVLGAPVVIAAGTGNLSDLARGLGGIFDSSLKAE